MGPRCSQVSACETTRGSGEQKKRERKYASLCESKPTQRTVLQDNKERREEEEKKGGKTDVNECGFTQQIEWKRQKRRKREFELCWCALTRNNNNVIITIK